MKVGLTPLKQVCYTPLRENDIISCVTKDPGGAGDRTRTFSLLILSFV